MVTFGTKVFKYVNFPALVVVHRNHRVATVTYINNLIHFMTLWLFFDFKIWKIHAAYLWETPIASRSVIICAYSTRKFPSFGICALLPERLPLNTFRTVMIPNNHDDKLNIYVLSQNNIDYYNKFFESWLLQVKILTFITWNLYLLSWNISWGKLKAINCDFDNSKYPIINSRSKFWYTNFKFWIN